MIEDFIHQKFDMQSEYQLDLQHVEYVVKESDTSCQNLDVP